MMSLRVICLILIVVLVSVHAPLVWLWVPVLLFGMFIVPWCGDLGERPSAEAAKPIPARPAPAPQRTLTDGTPEPERHIIDLDP